MRKSLLFLFILFGIANIVNAQDYSYLDALHLQNGSIIRGIIVEQVPGESVKIKTRDGNIFHYEMNDIQKITKEALLPSLYPEKEKGYYFAMTANLGLGLGQWPASRWSIDLINGYKAAPQFYIGFGIGINNYTYSYQTEKNKVNEYTLPLFVNLRSDFVSSKKPNDNKVIPFAALNFGYNVSITGGFFGGLIMEPSFGIRVRTSQKTQSTFSIGYSFDMVQYYNINNTYVLHKDLAQGIMFKIGLIL